jgi:serine/threonine-protein kinase
MAVIEDDDRARFGPYRIIRRIGTGGMGSVFEAEDTGLGHRVALKLLHPHVAARAGATRRFLREGRAAARIRHPHVVQVFALGTERDTPYLAMELLEGGSLSDLVLRKGALGLRDALDLVLPVIAGVAAAHDAGVIHRDLKPSNVCFAQRPGARPWPKVVDFSVSKVVSAAGANELTATDTVVGTAAYMAPEQARVASNASFRSDQYSLAVMLYQCITGELPFGGRSLYEILESVMSAPVVPPSARAPNIPATIDEAVLRGMSRSPEDRFPSVRAFAAALLHAASEPARAAYGTELLGESNTDTDSAIVKDIAPIFADAGRGHTPLVRTATKDGDSTAPTESTPRRKARAPTRYAGWLALGSLFLAASLAMRLTGVSRIDGASRGEKASNGPANEAAPPSDSAKGDAPDPADSPPTPKEPAQHASGTPPATGSASAARPTASPTRLERHRPAVVVSYGDNGAAILP